MTKAQVNALRAAAALQSGDLRILIALATTPSQTRRQLADLIGLTPEYLGNRLPDLERRKIVTRRVRVIGYDQVENIFMVHPGIDLKTIATQYVASALVSIPSNSDRPLHPVRPSGDGGAGSSKGGSV